MSEDTINDLENVDLDLERSLLGALMQAPHHVAFLSAFVTGDYFYRDAHRDAWAAIIAAHGAHGEQIDQLTIADALADQGWTRNDARLLVFGCVEDCPVAENAPTYASRLRDLAARRLRNRAGRELAAAKTDDEAAAALETLARAQELGDRGGTLRTSEEVVTDWVYDTQHRETTRIATGWPSIDRATGGGAIPGHVWIVAARTGVGKTWAMLNMLRTATCRNPTMDAVVVSLEMPAEELAHRYIALTLDEKPDNVSYLAERDQIDTHSVLRDAPELHRVAWYDGASIGVRGIPGKLEEARREGRNPRVVFVDYLGLLANGARKNATTYEQVSDTARALKDVARAERVAIIIACQLSRGPKGDNDGSQPVTLATLRDSGAVEEVGDVVLGMWAPGKKEGLARDEAIELAGVVETRVLKNRAGADGVHATLRYSRGLRLIEQEG